MQEAPITAHQHKYILYLYGQWRSCIEPMMTKITEEHNGRQVNITELVFDDWLLTQSKKTASRIIENIHDSEWDELRNTLTDAGYYTYARQRHIQINGVVDETDLAYI